MACRKRRHPVPPLATSVVHSYTEEQLLSPLPCFLHPSSISVIPSTPHLSLFRPQHTSSSSLFFPTCIRYYSLVHSRCLFPSSFSFPHSWHRFFFLSLVSRLSQPVYPLLSKLSATPVYFPPRIVSLAARTAIAISLCCRLFLSLFVYRYLTSNPSSADRCSTGLLHTLSLFVI